MTPPWGHSSPKLLDFIARPLLALAALGDAVLEHEFWHDADEEGGASDWLVALCVLGWIGLLLLVGSWLVVGEVPEA